jgi:hypothetical protein
VSPLLVLLGIAVVLVVYWMFGGLPPETQKRLRRTVVVLAGVGLLLLLVRVGQIRLAAIGTVIAAAARWLVPIAIRVLPHWLTFRASHPVSGDATGARPKAGVPSQMTRAEALDVLGLAEGASDEEVRDAYAALIKKVHPDRGGTAYLAARVNVARDLLLAKQKR